MDYTKGKKEPMDYAVLQETAQAIAQAVLDNAIKKSGLTHHKLTKKLGRSKFFIPRVLSGRHELTVKEYALVLAACGFEPRFTVVQIGD